MPLRITDQPLDLPLRANGQRIESRDLSLVTHAGHGLPIAGAFASAAFAIDYRIGIATSAALTAHLLLEAGGRREMSPWIPFASQNWRGHRLWDERGWRANLCASILACAALAAFLLLGK